MKGLDWTLSTGLIFFLFSLTLSWYFEEAPAGKIFWLQIWTLIFNCQAHAFLVCLNIGLSSHFSLSNDLLHASLWASRAPSVDPTLLQRVDHSVVRIRRRIFAYNSRFRSKKVRHTREKVGHCQAILHQPDSTNEPNLTPDITRYLTVFYHPACGSLNV